MNNKKLNEELTIIIKTFSRRKSLEKLLNSLIKNDFIDYKILILDDSKKNYKKYIENKFKELEINYIVTEFDIGLSKGRNILLNKVETDYFLLCDDDYVFDKRCKIREALKLIKQKNLDILGGRYYNNFRINNLFELLLTMKYPKRILDLILKKEVISDFCGKFILENEILKINITKEEDNELLLTDIVNNFFIGRTESIKKIKGWLEELKLGEHEEFFYRAKLNNLKVAFYKELAIGHYPIRNFSYNKFRKRIGNRKSWLAKYKIKDLKIFEK